VLDKGPPNTTSFNVFCRKHFLALWAIPQYVWVDCVTIIAGFDVKADNHDRRTGLGLGAEVHNSLQDVGIGLDELTNALVVLVRDAHL